MIGVMGGGEATREVAETAHRLGQAIASHGWMLVNGGRDAGVMAASAKGAHDAGGTVLGILPGRREDGGVAEGVTIPVFTGMGSARNVINVLSSDVVVVLPGAAGTLSEAAMAAVHDVPMVLLGFQDAGLLGDTVARAEDVDDAIAQVQALLAEASQR